VRVIDQSAIQVRREPLLSAEALVA